jgi:hypothetical protein
MPPAEYDFPYSGKLHTSVVVDLLALALTCGFQASMAGHVQGCAIPPGKGGLGPNECWVLLAKKEIVEKYYPYDWLIRHETAHCNGWRDDIVTAEKPARPVIEKPKVAVADKPAEKRKVAEKAAPRVYDPTGEGILPSYDQFGLRHNFFASPMGNDANDCLTLQTACRTATAATQKMPAGQHWLYLDRGVYRENLVIAHHQSVHIVTAGMNSDGGCRDPSLVTVEHLDIEHHASVWAHCFTIAWARCRQLAVLGAYSLAINGTHPLPFQMTETCRIHIWEKSWINGPIQGYARAWGNSTFFIAGEVINNVPGLNLAYFLEAVDSIIDMDHGFTRFSGHPISGLRFQLDHGVVIMPPASAGTVPGQGLYSVNGSFCRPAC